jgi:hypothetical protein
MAPAKDMQRAEVVALTTLESPRAVLVLCPGCNGDGTEWIKQAVWQQFAREHSLGLVGLSFASEVPLLTHGRGYYYVSNGSGQVLLDALRKIYHRDLPLLLYGFSGGAHFTSRFVEWQPQRVLSWCAYSAGWWDHPQPAAQTPSGIVACGDEDGERYGASLIYFKQGRAAGKPWTWVSVPKIGHARSSELEAFVRSYFTASLALADRPLSVSDRDARAHTAIASGGPEWRDVDTKDVLTFVQAAAQPSLSAWFPDHETATQWAAFHTP